MVKFRIPLMATVTVYAELEVIADSAEEAQAKAEEMTDDTYPHEVMALPWRYGEDPSSAVEIGDLDLSDTGRIRLGEIEEDED